MGIYIIIIASLVFSAFFSGMEIAYVSSNKLKIELDKNKGHLSARILSDFVKKPTNIIGALLIGNNIALVIYGIAIARALEPLIISILPKNLEIFYLIFILQTIISTILILIVAEFIPKVLFRINSNAILSFFAIPLKLFNWLFYPLVFLFRGLSEQILKHLFRIRFTKEKYSFGAVDLHDYVEKFKPES